MLGSVPADNGATSFRPPYAGTVKPLFSTGQLRTDLLPSLSSVSGAPSLTGAARRYQRVQLEFSNSWYGRYMHASENYAFVDNPSNSQVSEYGAEVGRDSADVALRLMLNDSISAKMPALINYVQAGIDIYGVHNAGTRWSADGGHFFGRKLPVVFAATLLNDATMKSEIANADPATYGEDGHFYYSTNQSTIAAMQAAGYAPALFGKSCDTGAYEQNQSNNGNLNSDDCRDPIGMIDGGYIQDGYQICCTSAPMKGISLAARLLPGGKTTWDYNPFHDYIDRWVGFGVWGQPDNWNSLGRTPARNYATWHGREKDGGDYGSSFIDNMWTAHRNKAQ